MPPAPVPERTPCNTLAEWNQHVKDAMLIINQPETEENWDHMERAFLVLASVIRGGAYKLDADFLPGVRTIARATANAMLSDRSRLSGTGVELLTVIGARMGVKFEPLIPLFIPTLLKLCTRSGKIYVNRAQNCLKLFAAYCRLPPLVTLLKESITDKSVTLRFAATDALHDLLSTSVRDGLPRRGKWVEDVEAIIRITARDSSPETRKMSRRAFTSYCRLWPERVADFVGPLSPTTRRYLDINDNTKVESSKQASQVASSSSARRSPTLSRTRSATSLAARPIPTVMSHTRTASEQPVQSDSRPTCPPLRTVRSTNFRSGATSSAKPATQPFFTEQPQQSIEPLVYQTNRPRSAASSLRQDRPPSSRSTKEPEAAPITTDIGLAAEAAVLVPAASTTSTNSLSTTRQNVPPTRERQYPFVSSGFIPKSRREREAEAAVTPLPPSPSSSHLSEVHKPPTSEVVEEPPVSNEPTEPPPAGPPREIEPVASAQRPTVPSSVTEKKTAPALVNKFQPSFRPRRGGGNIDLSANSRTQSQVQARKVSAFGAPAIITKVQPVAAPPVHFAPVVAIGTTTKSAPKNKPTLHTIGLPGMGSRSAASSVSSRSVSAHAGNNVAAANSVVGPNDAESASHFSKTIASSRGRVVSNPATKSTATQNSELLPAAAPKHETRVRNATGMTLSQLLKQKPPVHKKGFMPTSKLRGAKSNANLKGALPSAQRQHQHPSPSESSSNVESEIAARVPLPPSPKVGIAHPLPAGIPLPPSPVLAAAQVGGRISPGHDEPHHSFPTIESIKERLSEVLRPESPSSVLADALSESGATVATCISVPESEEPEFTLDDLEIPQCAPDPMVNVPSVLAAADTGSGDNLEITEFDFVQVGEPMVPTSRPSSPVKSLAEKPSRELELRTVLGEVGINMEV